MKSIFRVLLLAVPLVYLFYSKLLYLSSNNIGDITRYVHFFAIDSSSLSFEPIFIFFHYLISVYDIDSLLLFSIIGSLVLSLLIVESRFLIGGHSGLLGGLFVLIVFAILPPDSSVFSTFLSAWRFLYGFFFLLLGILFLYNTDSQIVSGLLHNLSKLMASVFFVLASISHSTTLIFSFILLLVYFRSCFIDSLLLMLYRLRLKHLSFARIKALNVILPLILVLILSFLASLDYFSARISHYSDFSSFEGSYFQVLLSVILSITTSFCVVSFSRGFSLGPLAKAYAVLPLILIPLVFVSPASAYRLSTQYYFLGFICLSLVFISSFVRSCSWRKAGLFMDSR